METTVIRYLADAADALRKAGSATSSGDISDHVDDALVRIRKTIAAAVADDVDADSNC